MRWYAHTIDGTWCPWRLCKCTRAVRARLMCAMFEVETFRAQEAE